MNSVRAGHCLMVSLWMLRYHTIQCGYSIRFPACQSWCSDPPGWDLDFWRATSCPVWNRLHVSSRQWLSWRSLPLWAGWPPRLGHGPRYVLDAREVVLSGSATGGGAKNSISAVGTTPVHHLQCKESHSVPKSPTLQGYSPIKWTVATPLQLSQAPICKALPLQPRWKSVQDPSHLPPVLLAYQHPKPTSSQGTRWPKPGVPDT